MKNVVECLLGQRQGNKYNEDVRSFALTMNYLSRRAYNFLREKFNNHLPSLSTVRKWYANSSANGQPGITKESLDTLRTLVNNAKSNNNEIVCALNLDEMHIRRHVQWCDNQKKFIGHITYGSRQNHADYLPVASNALVFMLNGINSKFNLPLAFYFINTLNTSEKASLIIEIIEILTRIGVKIVVISFDGLSTNTATCNLLGACLSQGQNFKPFILNPVNQTKIRIILDPPHMLKLIRNCIGSMDLYDNSGGKIQFKYFETLSQLREQKDIVTHRITKEHIAWDRNKMKVALATQLLSSSAAKSMRKLKELGFPDFVDCEPTANFTEKMDKLFDIFNSNEKNTNNKFKLPINIATKNDIFNVLDECAEYISGLTVGPNRQSILKCRRKTAFNGFLIDIHNLKCLYNELVEAKIINALPAYRLNQDPLECLFGRIRSHLGQNTNPTVEQFCSTYRKTLVNIELTCSVFSNCRDNLDILRVSSSAHNQNQTPRSPPSGVQLLQADTIFSEDKIEINNNEENTSVDENENGTFYIDGSDITLAHISGIIEHKIRNVARFNCEECLNVLDENKKCSILHVATQNSCVPTQSTFHICKTANRFLMIHASRIDFIYADLLKDIKNELQHDTLFDSSDFQHDEAHKQHFIMFIVHELIRIRATYLAKNVTLHEQKKFLRRKLHRTIHIYGQ